MSDSKKQLSFQFAKHSQSSRRLTEPASVAPKDDDVELVHAIDRKRIKGDRPKAQPLVIPLLTTNNWRSAATPAAPGDLNAQAVQELLDEARKLQQPQTNHTADADTAFVPILMQNRVPAGFETDDKLDVSLRPDGSVDADYEKIPIEAFGKAMLRGMGWKEGMGIGKRHRDAVAPLEPVLRPKGLGLGADKALKRQLEAAQTRVADDNGQKLELKKDAFCQLLAGPNRGLYGQVTSMDGDVGRAVVRLTVSKKSDSFSLQLLRPVSRSEYDRFSKYMNKDKADKIAALVTPMSAKLEASTDQLDAKPSPSLRPASAVAKQPWLRSSIRVRVIDEHVANGRLYEQKVNVVDVMAPLVCTCRADDGRLHEGLEQHMLETVVPRRDGAVVCVVASPPHNGQLATIVSRSKRDQVAKLQLLDEPDVIFSAHFDAFCEFVGDAPLG